jgi:LysM repeat protein
MEKRMENPSKTEKGISRDPIVSSYKKQRFTLSFLEIIFGSLIVVGLIYIGYIIFFQDSSGTAKKLEKRIKYFETSSKDQGEKIDQKIKAIQDSQTRWESRLKALEAANQDLSVRLGKIQQQRSEDKKPSPTSSKKAKIEHKVKKGETLQSIARKYKVSLDDLLQWNKRSKNKPVRAGDTLIIFPR